MRKLFSPALLIALGAALLFTGCKATHTSKISYPPGEEIYVTSGDGNFGEYTPVGQLYFRAQGWRLPVPFLACIPVGADVQPSRAMRQEVKKRARQMGGDAVINLRLRWEPPNNRILTGCFPSNGGSLTIYGNVIKR